MDFISHGLWGGLLLGRRNKRAFWWSFALGVAPDALSFGIFFVLALLGFAQGPDFGPPDPNSVPGFVYSLYDLTHSLVIFGAVFLLVWLISSRPFLPLLAWGFHIILDIFTHSADFFPTPFLWPVSDFKVDAWSWGNWWIFAPNILVLIVLYLCFFVVRRAKAGRAL